MSCLGQAPQHDSDHGEAHEGGGSARVSFEVACQAAIAADPCQRPLDDPSLGKYDEFMRLIALDDFDDPAPCGGGGLCHAWSLIAGVGEDALDEREGAAGALIENQACPVAILDIGGMNDDVQEQA
jgi:hypothetical protein